MLTTKHPHPQDKLMAHNQYASVPCHGQETLYAEVGLSQHTIYNIYNIYTIYTIYNIYTLGWGGGHQAQQLLELRVVQELRPRPVRHHHPGHGRQDAHPGEWH